MVLSTASLMHCLNNIYEHQKNGRVEGALDRADEEDGKTRGSESTRGLHKEKSTVRMEKLVY